MYRELFDWVDNLGSRRKNKAASVNASTVKPAEELLTFPSSQNLSDAEVIFSYGGIQQTGLVLGGFSNEDTNIKKYRELAKDTLQASAIEEVINSMLVFSGDQPVKVAFADGANISDKLVKQIEEEFQHILKVMKFRKNGYSYAKDFYVDGKLLFHKLIDKNNIKAGIRAAIQIDPTTIKKIKDVDATKYSETGLIDFSKTKEYYLYKPQYGLRGGAPIYGSPMTISIVSSSAIASADSGLYDDGRVVSYLEKSIIPYNNLKLLEEAIIIYRVARAPERKAFYIDVNGMPPTKADEYMKKQMQQFRTGMKFDRLSGKLDSKTAAMSIVEDYWFPRRNGQATSIENIEGGTMLNSIDDIDYFYEQYVNSLSVPKSRLLSDASQSIFGLSAEITRDEYKFLRFIDKLQQQFSMIFYDLLKTQLMCKNIVDESDWDDLIDFLTFEYENDNAFYSQRKLSEINSKLAALQQASEFEGKYFSPEWIMKNILEYNDEEIKEALKMREDMKAEMDDMGGDGFDVNPSPPNNTGTDIKQQVHTSTDSTDDSGEDAEETGKTVDK